MKRVILFTFLVLLSCWVSPIQTAAAFDIGLSPARTEEIIPSGQEKTIVYSLINGSTTENLRIQVSVLDWFLDERGEVQSRPPGTYPYSASDWVEISPAEFVVKPRQTQLVRVTYKVPGGTKAGDYLTCLMFRQRVIVPPAKQRLSGTLVPEGAISSLAYITVPPAEKKPSLEAMHFEPASGDKPPEIVWTIKNDGNSHIRPTGNIQIKDTEDKTVVSEGVKNMSVVLRNSTGTRGFPVPMLAPGKYKALLNLDLDPETYKYEKGTLDFEIAAAPAKPAQAAPIAPSSKPAPAAKPASGTAKPAAPGKPAAPAGKSAAPAAKPAAPAGKSAAPAAKPGAPAAKTPAAGKPAAPKAK